MRLISQILIHGSRAETLRKTLARVMPFDSPLALWRMTVTLAANNTRHTMSETSPKITAYLKTFCGWSEGVRAVMRKYDLAFEEKDIIKNPAFRWEMETRSGQGMSPCVEINGQMLADVSGDEVEAWMVENGLVEKTDVEADAPTNASCSDEQHAAMARAQFPTVSKIRFFS